MSYAILTTLFGSNRTLLDSFGELAAPCLAGASGTSRKTLIPMMDMLPTRGDWHKPNPASHSTSVLLSRVCNCDQYHSGFGDMLSFAEFVGWFIRIVENGRILRPWPTS
jgi:hypothetical protein